MFDIEITANIKDFNSFMKNLKTQTSTLKNPMTSFGQYLVGETKNQFKNAVDPEGNKWAKLSEATLRRKTTSQILVETGVMKSSVFFKAEARTFQFGLSDPKYSFHHFGTHNMPARVVVGLTDERREKRNQLIIAHLRRTKGRKRKK